VEVVVQQRLWAGIDAGKTAHHCMVVDADGQRVLSRRIDNDESALLELIRAVTSLAEGGHLTWAIDLNAGGAALLITLLLAHDQELLYIPGRTVHHAAGSYRGDGKTDAKDATIIADQARMRRDLHPLRRGDELVAELRILTSRRSDLSADRTRTINRLRARLGEYFPALERAFDYSNNQAALILLTGYQTPAALRRIGTARLETWLQNRHARKVSSVAASAVAAADTQYTVVPGEQLAADLVARLTPSPSTVYTPPCFSPPSTTDSSPLASRSSPTKPAHPRFARPTVCTTQRSKTLAVQQVSPHDTLLPTKRPNLTRNSGFAGSSRASQSRTSRRLWVA
jgi:hypothetical protein